MPSVHDGEIVASVTPSVPLGTEVGEATLGDETDVCSGTASARRRSSFELAPHPGSAAQARKLTRAHLSGWAVCDDTCDAAALVISELVTNAIIHTASSRIVCELHDSDDRVRIAVRDEGWAPGEPHPARRVAPEEEHGRGLLLVAAVSTAWGAQETGPGLLVWAELARDADSAHDTGAAGPEGQPAVAGPRGIPGPQHSSEPHTGGAPHSPDTGPGTEQGPAFDTEQFESEFETGCGTGFGPADGPGTGTGAGAGWVW
ncbi:ATP-binding protein [Streptomyces sp. CB01635]|uniref:ATP-binding protein n=1 Tax=Streptomyces sp. NPDC000188 TaxID=3154245 RepID=UPI001F3E1426|nr:ATP-binding protein [Streptomyces sp. CB01635]